MLEKQVVAWHSMVKAARKLAAQITAASRALHPASLQPFHVCERCCSCRGVLLAGDSRPLAA